MAYYSVFSLGPIIVIAIGVASVFLDRETVGVHIAATVKDMVGETGANAIQAILAEAGQRREGILASLFGLGVLFLAAIGVVVQLKDALNTVWEVNEPTGKGGVWSFVRDYIISFAAVLTLGFLLLVSLIVSAGLAAFGKYVAPHMQEALFQSISTIASVGVISLVIAAMFKWLPDTPVVWSDVWLGAVVTAVLFEIGKFAIGFYIGKQGLESTYGAAASIIVVLIWVYYSSQIILIGAEFTYAYSKRNG